MYATPPSTSAKQHLSCSSKQSPEPHPVPHARTKQSPASHPRLGRAHRLPAHTCSPTSASTHSALQPVCSESPLRMCHVPPRSCSAAASPDPVDWTAE